MMLAPMRLFANDRPVARSGAWLPATDIREVEDAFLVSVELPGVDPKALEITLDRNVLTISGEKSEEKVEEQNDHRFTERRYGSFRRSFRLPEGVDAETVKATGKDGVVTIRIGKKAEAKPRVIPVEG